MQKTLSMKHCLILPASLIFFTLFAQDKKTNSIQTTAILYATVDRAGDLYVVTEEGIKKYDAQGNKLNSYPSTGISSFDTGNGVRLLAYKRNTKEYAILTPSLREATTATLDSTLVIEPVLVASSGDYNLLIADAGDRTIKKIDTRDPGVLTEVKIDTSKTGHAVFTLLRAYQTLIFLLEKQTGIQVYNSIGNYLRTIPAPEIEYFNFLGEELYYLHDGKINFIDLYTGAKRQTDFSSDARFVVLTEERLYAVNDNSIDVFEFTPGKDSQK